MVSDLARLATRHSAKDWEELARWIEDPHHREVFRHLLLELAEVSKAAPKARPPKKRKASKAARVREQLQKIRTEDQDRADLLDDVWLKLRQRELLPTLSALRAFAEALGFKGLKANRRDQAVTELMALLIELPGDSLDRKLRKAAVVIEERNLGDEYQSWVRLILQRPS
jgi:uncharacterized membrane protein YccC